MVNNGMLPIHNIVLEKLRATEQNIFGKRELENIIRNCRLDIKNLIPLDNIRNELRKNLGDLGLTETSIDKICKYVDWRFRITIADIMEIKKVLVKNGYLYYGSDHKLHLKK